MEEMKENAKAYFNASPLRVKQSAYQFFVEMDINRNKRVELKEYVPFMKRRGYTQMCNDKFFNLLDVGRKGYLECWDVMTLYYIVTSGRPFCDGCGNFIVGTFFTCLKCFQYSKYPSTSSTFNLCSYCFRRQNYCHNHKQFLDNFLLLEFSRVGSNFNKEKIGEYHKAQPGASNPGIYYSSQSAQTMPSSSNAIIVVQDPQRNNPSASNPGIYYSSQSAQTKPSSSNAIIVAQDPQRNNAMLKKAVQLMELAVAVGNAVVAFQFCTIM